MGWHRALQKNSLSSSEKLLFRTCLDCFQSTQNLHVDRIGNLKQLITWWKQTPSGHRTYNLQARSQNFDHCATGPLPPEDFAFLFSLCAGCKGLGFGLGCVTWKIVFSARPLVNLRNETQLFFLCPRTKWSDKPGFAKIQFFRLWEIVFAHWRGQARHCEKTFFRDLKNCFFRTARVKLSYKPGFAKKNQALKKCFFACLLLNLPTPPHYLV